MLSRIVRNPFFYSQVRSSIRFRVRFRVRVRVRLRVRGKGEVEAG
jgi:hypothetical protein